VIIFQAEELHDIATRIFQAAGSDPEPTAILVDHLIDANLAGHDSHGVQHIPGYVKAMQSGAIQPNARPELLRETPVSALVDFATAAVAAGKLGVAQAKHEQMAPEILIDREGNPTTDPRTLSEGGAILPAGGPGEIGRRGAGRPVVGFAWLVRQSFGQPDVRPKETVWI